MQNDHQMRDAASPLVSLSWTIEKCVDIRRSISVRVANARKREPWSDEELEQMAMLYASVHLVERSLRMHSDYPDLAPLPEWVLRDRK